MSHHSRQPSVALTLAGLHTHPPQIGPWRLGRTLGRGATGRVLLGTHHLTGQKAAVKVVSKSELGDDARDQTAPGSLPYGIEREIIIMKLLTHPNVLRLYDVWETSKALYLVLEYVEGGELFDLLVERGPLHEAEAVKYFRQIVLGTAYCHALGICHRDLKPENLLLDASLNVKLADFGMAALESNGRLLETSCGSPHYAAPEIVSGLKYHGAASDVWSCGVILFALLTGRLPFDDENIRHLLLKVQAGAFTMPQELSTDAQDLIAKMLTADPTKRIPTAHILSHPLLSKYPCPNEDLVSVKSLPHPQTAHKLLGLAKNIDQQILQNLLILWHDRSPDDIVRCLLAAGPNPEKTFYALLLRYRHNQDDNMGPQLPKKQQNRGMVRSASLVSNNLASTPRKKRTSRVNALLSRNRPVLFQYKNGVRTSTSNGRFLASSSVNNSPYKLPLRRLSHRSPYKLPLRRYASRSPTKSPVKHDNYTSLHPAVPRNIYNEIVNAQMAGSVGSLPPTLPSKDTIYDANPVVDEMPHTGVNELASAPRLSPSKGAPKRTSTIKTSTSKNRLSRRKLLRASMTTGLKRNSITMKLLSTYAKLAGETDWEYMDKQTKRTSATFATLCDKIFNQEDYDEDDEKLIDDEEKRAREYERLMEIERKKHEAEMRARKELAKHRKRQKRKLLLLLKKLLIWIKDDNNSDTDITVHDPILQPKRQLKLRLVSERPAESDDLTLEDLENIKRRLVTQPEVTRRRNPVLTRRPVSRLDPLWTAYENEEVTRAQDALEAEYRDTQKARKRANRELMISVGGAERLLRNSEFERDDDYELPEPDVENSVLSEEYMSEIRKSRLLNLQQHLAKEALGNARKGLENPRRVLTGTKKNDRRLILTPAEKLRAQAEQNEPQTLISGVRIPTVTRKLRHFTPSNKRLSVLTMGSTKESYRDLNSIMNEDNDVNMPLLRTSFADRLDRAGLPDEEDEEPLDEGSILDFDEHLASKRILQYLGAKRQLKYAGQRPVSQLPDLPSDDEGDETFATKHDRRRRDDAFDDDLDDAHLFEKIKLPEKKRHEEERAQKTAERGPKPAERDQKTKSHHPTATSMLIPDASKIPETGQLQNGKIRKPKIADTIPPTPPSHGKKPLDDTTNVIPGGAPQKRNRLLFRKLLWGSKKALDDAGTVQLPLPADSRAGSVDEKRTGSGSGGFFRWLLGSHDPSPSAADIKRFNTILPKQEMLTALFALLSSWLNFGLKNLKNDTVGYNITGGISLNNMFNLKSCKFRIKINPRDFGQKLEIVCARVKGSKVTADTLFKEIEKVLRKEGVMDR